ncbi:hypothetical protein Bhyg_03981 [Pseudolycoriella hygida]|uniref:Uncharacterized protein n=1 Tax=Pseudolycoriella hygida TaxID=35572 RepID=A0A9Q0NEF2_9DIPT|nr:hypothetical protein Bhyg_03981 [Pseudolycoriella hygida]
MNFVLLLLLVLTQQSTLNASDESFSGVLKLYKYAETQLTQAKSMFSMLMENAAIQQKKFSNELRSETIAYLNKEQEKLVDDDEFEETRKRISDCAKDVEDTIEFGIKRFIEILDDAERMVNVLEDKLSVEPSSDDIDDINDEVDDIIGDFKDNFEGTMVPLVEQLLLVFKDKLVSLPLSLQECVDKIIN